MPHGMCWFWNPKLITVHAVSDFATFLCYMAIPIVFIYIYRTGKISKLKSAYPRLWVLGAGFIGTCGLSHLGAFLEIWFGGTLYWWTGLNKSLMAIVSWAFFFELFKHIDRIALTGKILFEVDEEQHRREISP